MAQKRHVGRYFLTTSPISHETRQSVLRPGWEEINYEESNRSPLHPKYGQNHPV